MIPTIGRTVHYTSMGSNDGAKPPEVRAAIITAVNAAVPEEAGKPGKPPTVALRVFTRTDTTAIDEVEYTDEPAGSAKARGRWCWPARDVPQDARVQRPTQAPPPAAAKPAAATT